jgi:PAS domain S-box-containing protein
MRLPHASLPTRQLHIWVVQTQPQELALITRLAQAVGWSLEAATVTAVVHGEPLNPPDSIIWGTVEESVAFSDRYRQLRAQAGIATVPVLCLGKPADLSPWIVDLADDYIDFLSLPLQPEEILARISRQVSRQQHRQLNAQLQQQTRGLEALIDQRTLELQTCFEALPDYVYMHAGSNFKFVLCNDRQAKFLGFETHHQVVGKTLYDCLPWDYARTFAEQNLKIMESGEIFRHQETWHLPEGDRYLDTIKVPLKRSDGEIYGLVGVSRDITDLVEMRQALAQRTAELEASNRELEFFSYSVSHDLRAPLRHIHGFVNALQDHLALTASGQGALADPKVRHYLSIIEESSRKMAHLIDGLLTLSRLGRRQLALKTLELRPLVEAAIALVETPEDYPAITFDIGSLPSVQGDPILLQQVLVNLIDNAVKFSRHHPHPRIEIGSLPEQTIFVRDNGAGFPMQYADKLFGAFQRLHSQREFEGTGIGLAIVQQIIQRHGGQIWAESQPDHGATFFFKLGDL